MSQKLKDALIIVLSVATVVLICLDVVCILHSVWFAFTNIHLTRMEALFAPENYMVFKLACVGFTYLCIKGIEYLG